ncbi:MAG TPA: energy transducer TonB [Povalibacter sp.]
MQRQQRLPGTSPRHMSVFVVTCALHAAAIYFLATVVIAGHEPLWSSLEVSFIPTEKPQVPPPPPPVPVLLSDAFAERQLLEIRPPDVELGVTQESSQAINAPRPPDPLPQLRLAPEEGQGYGPLTRPRVVSRPRNPEDRYPRASIRHGEAGLTVVNICISAAGTVDSVDVAQSSGYRRLDEAAMDMSLDYVFAPAVREGKAIPVCLPYSIEFRVALGRSRRAR